MSDAIRFQGYAKGAVRTHAELLDLIIEARKCRKAIRLYTVQQGGYFSEIFITSKSKIEDEKGRGIWSFNGWAASEFSPKGQRHYRTHWCLGDLNITDKAGHHSTYNRHQLFRNRRAALEYSEALKNDVQYIAAVAEHHRRCSALFRDRGWGFAA